MTTERKNEIIAKIQSKDNANLVEYLSFIASRMETHGYTEEREFMHDFAIQEIMRRMK